MLYKRGRIWWVKFKVKGETIARSSGTTSKRKAAEVERELRTQIARELHYERTGKPVNYTYEEALLRWINEGAPKGMWSPARNTRPYLDHVPLHLVVPKAHEMKGDMLKRGLSPQTINRRLAVVRRILNIAYKEWEWITEPLGQKIKLLSEKGMAREFYLSQDEVETLVEAIDCQEVKKVVLLAAYTGLRKSEILGLTESNWQKPYIVLESKTKSKKARSVPVIKDLHDIVTLPFNTNVSRVRFQFERARDRIQRPELRFHDLRHTYASWLAKDPNTPLTVIRDVLGHSSLMVTSKYAHLQGQHAEMIENALKRVTKGGTEKSE